MRAFTFSGMPKAVLVAEALGGIILLLSYFALHQMLPLPASFSGPAAATILLIVGIALMLPAAAVMMWRTAKAMAPELFNVSDRHKPGEKHDADH
ncbi:YbjC family protein [Kalamiella sp. sgz302252]|uniref:YbjC family protein n=1 Tax=Pantoea sp. sgz302252 TaxID=3341827 RepID=UPI0036D3DD17